jgi:hypothetical protein
MLVGQQSGESLGLVAVQPVVDGIRLPGLEQPLEGDGVRGLPLGHLQEGGTAFPDVGAGVMVAVVGQLLTLLFAQAQGTTAGHRLSSSLSDTLSTNRSPVLIVKTH